MSKLYLSVIGLLLVLISYSFGYDIKNTTEASQERRLLKYLFYGYEPAVRPVRQTSDTIDLNLDLSIRIIEDLDEVNQVLRSTAYFRVMWNDFQLSWKPEEFDEVDSVRVPTDRIWMPDLEILDNANTDMSAMKSRFMAVLSSDGKVMWIPQIKLETHCLLLDLTYFPFDEHVCSIVVMSWTYSEKLVNISQWGQIPDGTEQTMEATEWQIKSYSVQRHSIMYGCCPDDSYVDLTYSITLKRQSTFASHLFMAPSITLCLIVPAIFILPPASFEKFTFGTGVLIGHVLLLGELIKFVPSAHPTVPLMGKFFLANIVMVSLSLAISAVVVNLWNRSRTRLAGPPNILCTVLLNDFVTRVLLIDFTDFDEITMSPAMTVNRLEPAHQPTPGSLNVMTDVTVDDPGNSGDMDDRARIVQQYALGAAKSDWCRLVVVLDRLFFIIFSLVLVIICLAFNGYL